MRRGEQARSHPRGPQGSLDHGAGGALAVVPATCTTR
jgi:hypothetical protein